MLIYNSINKYYILTLEGANLILKIEYVIKIDIYW